MDNTSIAVIASNVPEGSGRARSHDVGHRLCCWGFNGRDYGLPRVHFGYDLVGSWAWAGMTRNHCVDIGNTCWIKEGTQDIDVVTL